MPLASYQKRNPERAEFTHTLARVELRRGHKERGRELMRRAEAQAIAAGADGPLREQIVADLRRIDGGG